MVLGQLPDGHSPLNGREILPLSDENYLTTLSVVFSSAQRLDVFASTIIS